MYNAYIPCTRWTSIQCILCVPTRVDKYSMQYQYDAQTAYVGILYLSLSFPCCVLASFECFYHLILLSIFIFCPFYFLFLLSTDKENSIYFIGFRFSLVCSFLFKKSLGEPGVQAIPHWIMWCAYEQVYKVFTVQQVNKCSRCATGWWCSALPAGGQGLFVASPFPTILCKNELVFKIVLGS